MNIPRSLAEARVSEVFYSLSTDAQNLFLRLYTQPGLENFGVLRGNIPGLASEYGLSQRRARLAFAELVKSGVAQAHRNFLFLPWHVHMLPINPNILAHMGAKLALLPDKILRSKVYEYLFNLVKKRGPEWLKALKSGFLRACQRNVLPNMQSQEQQSRQNRKTAQEQDNGQESPVNQKKFRGSTVGRMKNLVSRALQPRKKAQAMDKQDAPAANEKTWQEKFLSFASKRGIAIETGNPEWSSALAPEDTQMLPVNKQSAYESVIRCEMRDATVVITRIMFEKLCLEIQNLGVKKFNLLRELFRIASWLRSKNPDNRPKAINFTGFLRKWLARELSREFHWQHVKGTGNVSCLAIENEIGKACL